MHRETELLAPDLIFDLNLDIDPLPIKPSLDNSISSFVRRGSSSKSFTSGGLGA